MLESLLDFVFPSRCAVCSKPPSVLCSQCLPVSASGSFEHFDVPARYAMEYGPELGKVLSAYKDKTRLALAAQLSEQLLPILDSAIKDFQFDLILTPGSSRQNFKKSGVNPTLHLLKTSQSRIGFRQEIMATSFARQPKDQRSLGASLRLENLSGAMQRARVSGKRVLLFDDVYTTGATCSELIRSVGLGGGEVAVICVLAKRI